MEEHATRRLQALVEVGRISSILLDGDEASRIITPRAMYYIAHPDPDHPFLAGDYYDVDHATFLRMKKLLLRIERLLDFPCNAALWLIVADQPRFMTLAVQNGEIHRYYRFGDTKTECPAEILSCIDSQQVTLAPPDPATHTLTVLAPVFNSLGDVVGVLELSALDPDRASRLPAWS